MTIGEMLHECVKALENGATTDTPLVVTLHDLANVDELASVTRVELYIPEPRNIGYLEIFHDYSE